MCKMGGGFQQGLCSKMLILKNFVKKPHKPPFFVEPCGTDCDIIKARDMRYVIYRECRKGTQILLLFLGGNSSDVCGTSEQVTVSPSLQKKNKRIKIIQQHIMIPNKKTFSLYNITSKQPKGCHFFALRTEIC